MRSNEGLLKGEWGDQGRHKGEHSAPGGEQKTAVRGVARENDGKHRKIDDI